MGADKSTVTIYVFGKQYPVPQNLTILTAMEHLGYRLLRGCGCRSGFCGACATFVLKALEEGYDGVLIAGCHPGTCHYISGNYKAARRFALLRRMLKQMGIHDQRVRLEWTSASESDKFVTVVNEMVENLRKLETVAPQLK